MACPELPLLTDPATDFAGVRGGTGFAPGAFLAVKFRPWMALFHKVRGLILAAQGAFFCLDIE